MQTDSLDSFDLDAYLSEQSTVIDHALETCLEHYPSDSATIFRALRYGVFPGGRESVRFWRWQLASFLAQCRRGFCRLPARWR